MKKTLIITLLATVSWHAVAQANKEEVKVLQAVFGMEKKAVAEAFIRLNGDAKDRFWKAYDDYEIQRISLGQRRLALLDKYTSNYATLDDNTTEELVNDMIRLQGDTDKLIVTYYKKIKKAAGVKAAAQFYQLEGYVLSKIRTEIMENIPAIGELDKE
jgi:hypothetical protein